jgi:hypothetical protein
MEKNSKNNILRKIMITIILLTFLLLIGVTSSAQPDPNTYAPYFYFEGQETCYPVEASYHLENSDLYCFDGSSLASKKDEWTISDLTSTATDTCFLDNTQGTTKDNGVINHYKSELSSRGYLVYYRVVSIGSNYVIQYWMYYAFNKGELNQHEGDWEMVEIVFSDDNPSWVAYSQHHGGQSATWEQVEKEGKTHIKVYVARGSHANYLRSYSGKLGIASDIVGANGKILKPAKYILEDINDEPWLDYPGRWGEVALQESDAYTASILGQAGPEGPKFREGGEMWNNPISWGKNLLPTNDNFLLVEWFLYNIILIFLIVTLVILIIIILKIFRRYKKHGLGPHKISMFYINGANLHSIGNILCILAIIVAFFGLFNPWYEVSYSISGKGITDTFQTDGTVKLLQLDGFNGLQVSIPGTDGPVPMGSIVFPFSLFIAIGLIFLIIATIGIQISKKLGTKYIWRGIRLIIPFIIIILVIWSIGSIVSAEMAGAGAPDIADKLIAPIAESPMGGESSVTFSEEDITGNIRLIWGLGIGGWLLLFSGIIFIISGFLELSSNTQFFESKQIASKSSLHPTPIQPIPTTPLKKKDDTMKSPKEIVQNGKKEPSKKESEIKKESIKQVELPKKDKPKGKEKPLKFCPECGSKINENSKFCIKCSKKLK